MIKDFLILIWAIIWLISGCIWEFIFSSPSLQKQEFNYNEWAYRNHEINHEPAPEWPLNSKKIRSSSHCARLISSVFLLSSLRTEAS
ncbi:MAG: hypothetical protein UT05_C0009G0076 [Parcubacteria group bacterium GW2011_GWF2_38_76]|nr:MAG: hypothetical protein UT05_C0009G0076 [Parcubacteria group bacterium GW2011_GWF2_38_76]